MLNFNLFDLSVLQGVSPAATSASKILKIFLRFWSKSLKTVNSSIRQRKFKNNTDVYLQDFLQYYDEFMFLNHIEFKSYCTRIKAQEFNCGDSRENTIFVAHTDKVFPNTAPMPYMDVKECLALMQRNVADEKSEHIKGRRNPRKFRRLQV